MASPLATTRNMFNGLEAASVDGFVMLLALWVRFRVRVRVRVSVMVRVRVHMRA